MRRWIGRTLCGWLKDKYGVSWQVVPSVLPEMLTDADRIKSERVMVALMKMKKFDVAALQRAYLGQACSNRARLAFGPRTDFPGTIEKAVTSQTP